MHRWRTLALACRVLRSFTPWPYVKQRLASAQLNSCFHSISQKNLTNKYAPFPSGLTWGCRGGGGFEIKCRDFKDDRTETDTRGSVTSNKRRARHVCMDSDGAITAITKYLSSSETIKHIYSSHQQLSLKDWCITTPTRSTKALTRLAWTIQSLVMNILTIRPR